ncbi:hypothetical protein ACJJTC_014612 [Scirpophaga incertulas]
MSYLTNSVLPACLSAIIDGQGIFSPQSSVLESAFYYISTLADSVFRAQPICNIIMNMKVIRTALVQTANASVPVNPLVPPRKKSSAYRHPSSRLPQIIKGRWMATSCLVSTSPPLLMNRYQKPSHRQRNLCS